MLLLWRIFGRDSSLPFCKESHIFVRKVTSLHFYALFDHFLIHQCLGKDTWFHTGYLSPLMWYLSFPGLISSTDWDPRPGKGSITRFVKTRPVSTKAKNLLKSIKVLKCFLQILWTVLLIDLDMLRTYSNSVYTKHTVTAQSYRYRVLSCDPSLGCWTFEGKGVGGGRGNNGELLQKKYQNVVCNLLWTYMVTLWDITTPITPLRGLSPIVECWKCPANLS